MSSGGAPEGNQNAVKLKDKYLKREAYEQYCAHLAKGKSKKSFVFRHPELLVTYKTLDKYIADNPVDFPPINIEAAKIDGYAYWEQVVEDSAIGTNQEANTASLQMLMRNKFGWDKEEKDPEQASDAVKKMEEVFNFLKSHGKESEKNKDQTE